MKFGGHETFPVREGWLHKGLKLVVEDPEKLIDEHVADWLGVGRNMAKSIRYWLQATGLCEQAIGKEASQGRPAATHPPGQSRLETRSLLHRLRHLVGASREPDQQRGARIHLELVLQQLQVAALRQGGLPRGTATVPPDASRPHAEPAHARPGRELSAAELFEKHTGQEGGSGGGAGVSVHRARLAVTLPDKRVLPGRPGHKSDPRSYPVLLPDQGLSAATLTTARSRPRSKSRHTGGAVRGTPSA